MYKQLTGNDCDIDGQVEATEALEEQKLNNWIWLNHVFEGATPENSRGIGQKIRGASDELTRKID